jgi:hypothetical protein
MDLDYYWIGIKMEEWKIRQEVYHRINKDFRDDLKQFNVTIDDEIINNAYLYFTETDVGWIYPAKSYMVGICYAKWLSEHFDGEPIDYLNEEDLLYGNDPYFVPYNKDKETYDKLLSLIGGWNFNQHIGIVPDVKEYFNEEFMIENF